MLLIGWTASALGASHPPADASRAELEKWFVALDAAGVLDVRSAMPWQYTFSDSDGRKLEALSLALVQAGYRIAALHTLPSGVAQLRVSRVELHTPRTLERRNRELREVARAHGVRSYDGPDVVPP